MIGASRSDLNPLHLALYREHARRTWGAREILGFFDPDRRVNDLGRLRKPAFQRRQVPLGEPVWRAALILLERAQRRITELEKGKTASSTSAFTKSMPPGTTRFSTGRPGAR
ncbi:MAG: hypothetical protein HUU15_12370 [Candidatus Brocadiae bacterium]|nr:hypothetical protein [Candidatus Brocadiia bacterium]